MAGGKLGRAGAEVAHKVCVEAEDLVEEVSLGQMLLVTGLVKIDEGLGGTGLEALRTREAGGGTWH